MDKEINKIEKKFAKKEGYEPVPIISEPENEEAKIWRFIDFTQFVSILERRALFFTKVDNFQDSFEGILPLKSDQHLEKIYEQGEISEDVYKARKQMRFLLEGLKEYTYVNCWHVSEVESAVMWEPYIQRGSGVALQTTFRDLSNSLERSDLEIDISKIHYLDYNEDAIKAGHTIQPFFCKRESFKHENELRALFQDMPVEGEEGIKPENIHPDNQFIDSGLYIPAGDDLIEKIYLAPNTPQWLLQLTKSVAETYGLGKEKVLRSNLYDQPISPDKRVT